MFVKMRIAFEDEEAIPLNEKIFATIYYAAVSESIALAKKNGTYDSYEGSPASKGLLSFDMWGIEGHKDYDWVALKAEMKKYGMRNSLLIAPMPTASTS